MALTSSVDQSSFYYKWLNIIDSMHLLLTILQSTVCFPASGKSFFTSAKFSMPTVNIIQLEPKIYLTSGLTFITLDE